MNQSCGEITKLGGTCIFIASALGAATAFILVPLGVHSQFESRAAAMVGSLLGAAIGYLFLRNIGRTSVTGNSSDDAA